MTPPAVSDMTASKPAPPADRGDAWATCICGMERRLQPAGDAANRGNVSPMVTMVWAPHRRYVAADHHRPDELPGRMEPCSGSGLEPVSVSAPAFSSAD